MFTRPRPRLLLSVIALLTVLLACNLSDLGWQTSAPIPAPPTPQPYVPVPGHTLGETNAPITVEEYVDFQCPACGAFARGTLQDIKEKYVQTGQVKLILYHYPFIGDESTRAAEASECASDQGKFWEFVDLLFENQAGENQGAFADTKLVGFAQQLELDKEQFKACLDDGRHVPEIEASRDAAAARGITSVPTLFINDQMVRGAPSLKRFEQYLISTSK